MFHSMILEVTAGEDRNPLNMGTTRMAPATIRPFPDQFFVKRVSDFKLCCSFQSGTRARSFHDAIRQFPRGYSIDSPNLLPEVSLLIRKTNYCKFNMRSFACLGRSGPVIDHFGQATKAIIASNEMRCAVPLKWRPLE